VTDQTIFVHTFIGCLYAGVSVSVLIILTHCYSGFWCAFDSGAGGDFSSDSVCNKFYSYWQTMNYPGYISDGQNRTRSYVPYLIDAVTAYFTVIDNLIQANITVNALNVFQAFNGSGPGTPVFEGCTGLVSFDPETGSRNATAQIPIFDFVSLTPSYWEVCFYCTTCLLGFWRLSA